MKKTDKNLSSDVQRAYYGSLAQLLEKTPATGRIPEIPEDQRKSIIGTGGDVPAVAETKKDDNIEVRTEQTPETMQEQKLIKPGKSLNDKTAKAESDQQPVEVGSDQERLELWLENVKQRPSVRVDKKQIVHFDCELIRTFKVFSEIIHVPMNKIISAIVEDWLTENGDDLKQLQKKILLKILDKT